MTTKKPILLDANVLIDYAQADDSILQLSSHHLGPIYVPDPVVEEVDDLSLPDYDRLGLVIVQPTTVQMFAAVTQSWNSKIADGICYVLCQDNRWTCATNDRKVRSKCIEEGVNSIWGTELMLRLIDLGELSADEAIEVIQTIKSNNKYIGKKVVNAFITEAQKLERNRDKES